MSFQSFAEGPWVLPLLPWLATPIVLLAALRRQGFLRAWGIVFAILIAVDAWCAGAFAPFPSTSPWAMLTGVAFVIVGDFRYFLVVEASRKRRPSRAVAIALGLAFVVPLASQALRMSPWAARDLRVVYLVYEVAFFALLLAYGGLLGRASTRFERRLLGFELAQYGAWATVDALLLATKQPVLHLVRVVPNVLYYVAFVPFALASEARDEA